MTPLKIHVIRALEDNFIYALSDKQGRCAVVDPGESAAVINFLEKENLKLTHILCTHHHWDHVDGVPDLVAKFNVPVMASHSEFTKVPNATESLKEGEKYNLLGAAMQVIEVPGHTLGQICFWFPEMHAVFVGDTLFSCGCGRLFEGTYEQLFHSLGKISQLPSDTEIYFGHEYTMRSIKFLEDQGVKSPALEKYKAVTSAKIAEGLPSTPTQLATELDLNPFLKAKTVEELKHWREARNNWK
ncbi:MAG: hydroxyacylglutathione hydrolase [Bdellovibrionales bacterium]